ncbi:MAG: bifunctional UDP-N-acetylglucosamine diphosphorylase/glucosamine-1-phosphate N-acetyltransferase GlmU [Deltaproteobacteria bacterium]|nr:bifunctional UDP-N-acetylglucosamine diphosphorylase/glucosamine-1-phosphate N-acetyltransferase GlmU [Deltaproteobacteria bacterium]
MPTARTGGLCVVILAAGLGKRMFSQTPKVLHELLGEPMLGHVLAAAAGLNPNRLCVVTGHGGEAVERYVDQWARRNQAALAGDRAPTCVEQPHQGGTGHAVACAQPVWRDCGEVLVLYGDTPLLRTDTLQDLRRARGDGALSLLVGEPADPTGYGRVVRDAQGRVARVVEHKDADDATRAIRLINAGMMCVTTAFLSDALPRLQPNNTQGELYLTDLLAMATARGQSGAAHVVADRAEISGVNNRLELAAATAALRDRINRHWMLQGVSFDDPATATVEPSVVLHADCQLGAAVQLRGATVVHPDARIGAGCVVTDCEIGHGVHLLPYSVASEARIGARAHVGPFAHLRPGTVLEADVKVGNFVETKKARLGRGTKASHLSYLGDAEIGPACNIGAGTITCNYDGVDKHKTVLGRGVFIGSDTQLVAPVTLGDEAYVGAGTTVTQDVPAGALVVTRAPAVVKAGWVARKRELRALRATDGTPAKP